MAEIGATLREARMRQRIDITEVEAETKIRGKYLRALENEEWELLPGPDVRQELPAHLRRLPRARRPLAGRGVQAPVRAPRDAGDRAAQAARAGPPAASRARPAAGGQPRCWIGLALVAVVLIGLFVLGRGDKNKNSGSVGRPRPRRPGRRPRTTTASGTRRQGDEEAAVATREDRPDRAALRLPARRGGPPRCSTA